jgi:geranylgeranyl diphosphate synthase type 3
MDDVEDNSDLRRGVPVAHQVYGVPQTINTANYVYFLAFDELLKLRPLDGKGKGKAGDMVAMVNGELFLAPLVVSSQTDELLNLHRGQGMDLYWRDSLTCPTEEEYVQMTMGSELAVLERWANSQKPVVCSASLSSS